MKKIFILLLLPFFMMGFLQAKQSIPYNQKKPSTMDNSMAEICPQKAAILRCDLRKLWEEHISYTRNYIISALSNLSDVSAVANRLMKNQEDIGKALKTYYGKEVGNKVTALLKDHIKIAMEVVKVTKERNKTEMEKADKKWYENADQMVGAFNGINPNWEKAELKDLLYKHLKCTAGEVTSRMDQNWKDDMDNYDKGHEHILKLADMMAFGIMKQFPDQFKKP